MRGGRGRAGRVPLHRESGAGGGAARAGPAVGAAASWLVRAAVEAASRPLSVGRFSHKNCSFFFFFFSSPL